MSVQFTVRQALFIHGIHYNDVFYMTYKSNPEKRVGIMDTRNPSLREYEYESQSSVFSYFHDQDFKGLALAYYDANKDSYDVNPNYLKDPFEYAADPYLIQRVTSLIMNDEVNFHIVHRHPMNPFIWLIQTLCSIFLLPTHRGREISGPCDD